MDTISSGKIHLDIMIKNIFLNLKDLEMACREYFLKSDMDLTAIALGVAAILVTPMNYLDYRYYGWSWSYLAAALFEVAFAVVSIRVIFITRRNYQVKTYERWVFGWALFTTVSIILIVFGQSNRIIENILFSQLLLIAIYTLMANRLAFKLIPALTVTAACLLALLMSREASFANKYMLTISFLMVNTGGILLIAYINLSKKMIYESHNSEDRLRRSLQTLAITDPLTGIPNRRSFFEQAQQEFSRFERIKKTFCLVMLDLDLFKNVNDQFGHLAGDEALKEFTACILSSKRFYDLLGRIGGEEFCLILPETNLDVGRNIVSRIRDHVHELVINSPKGEIRLTFSAGITCAHENDESLDDLLRRADDALYAGKNKGRDRIEVNS